MLKSNCLLLFIQIKRYTAQVEHMYAYVETVSEFYKWDTFVVLETTSQCTFYERCVCTVTEQFPDHAVPAALNKWDMYWAWFLWPFPYRTFFVQTLAPVHVHIVVIGNI